MITTIVLSGIIAVGLANILQHPMNGYAAVSQRAELAALADVAHRRLVDDLQNALPGSLRVSGSGTALEMMLVSDGGRYREAAGTNDPGGPNEQDHTDATDLLSFAGDSQFNVLGRLPNRTVAYGSDYPTGTRLAIDAQPGTLWSQAVNGSNPGAITPASTRLQVLDDVDEDQVFLSAPHTFTAGSANRRLYFVDSSVTYLCDIPDESLWRISGYSFRTTQPINRSTAPLSSGTTGRVSDRIESCRFAYVPGVGTRPGLVTFEIVLVARDERIRLLKQIGLRHEP